MKLRISCDACAHAKIGCTKEKPACARCRKRGFSCLYAATKRARRSTLRHHHPTTSHPRPPAPLHPRHPSATAPCPARDSPPLHHHPPPPLFADPYDPHALDHLLADPGPLDASPAALHSPSFPSAWDFAPAYWHQPFPGGMPAHHAPSCAPAFHHHSPAESASSSTCRLSLSPADHIESLPLHLDPTNPPRPRAQTVPPTTTTTTTTAAPHPCPCPTTLLHTLSALPAPPHRLPPIAAFLACPICAASDPPAVVPALLAAHLLAGVVAVADADAVDPARLAAAVDAVCARLAACVDVAPVGRGERRASRAGLLSPSVVAALVDGLRA